MMSTLQGAILGVILAAFMGLGLTVFLQHRHSLAEQARYEALLKDNAGLQAENTNWKMLGDQQNQKIAQLAAAQQARDADMLKAMISAKTKAKRYASLAAKIAAQKTAADDCAGAQAVKGFYLEHVLVK